MASKRKTREAKKRLKERQKRNRAKKIEFRRMLLKRQFTSPQPVIHSFPVDDSEYIIAEYQRQEEVRREILFRQFDISTGTTDFNRESFGEWLKWMTRNIPIGTHSIADDQYESAVRAVYL